VEIHFVAQPFEGGTDLRDFLHAVAEDDGLNTLRIVVAWAKRSGLGRAISDLQAVRSRGGRILTIVGVSEGRSKRTGTQSSDRAERRSLRLSRCRPDLPPKIYLADGTDRALLLVGSHNLTAGGMAWNYEAGLWCYLDLELEADKQARDDVIAYFDQLRSDAAVCIALNSSSLTAIWADTSLLIQMRTPGIGRTPWSPMLPKSPIVRVLFKIAQQFLYWQEPAEEAQGPEPRAPSPVARPPRKPAPVMGSVSGERPPISVMKRWFKELDGTAAQQPPARLAIRLETFA